MRKFNVTVNGTTYEVDVEEIGAGATVAAPVAAPAPAAAPADGIKVSAPMPGTIVGVNVAAGQKVEKGTVLCILEAMKMENEIQAPEAGTVASVSVTKGASVNTGDLLVVLA